MDLKFRDLRADEIDCRVAQVGTKGLSLLLYKDARCDMNILDETVGPMNWMRHHSRDNANCTVSIHDSETGFWVDKEDTGTESNTEAEKGLASDSFKRACVNWGIGRELYTAPFIWVKSGDYEPSTNKAGKPNTNDRFEVVDIVIEDKRIVGLAIKNARTGAVVYTFGKVKAVKAAPAKKAAKAQEVAVAPAAAVIPASEVDKTPTITPVCTLCGEVISDVKLKNGGVMTAAQVVSYGLGKFPDHGPLCARCQGSIVKAKKEA